MHYGAYSTDSLMTITNRPDLVFERGEGSWLTDHQGKRYLDFIQGWAVNCLGHCPAEITDALVKQAKTLLNPSPAFYNGPMVELAGLLTANSVFDRVFFANTGAEANEGAIKLARKWGKLHRNGAYEIITFDHSFHGRTLATMSASGKAGWDVMYAPQVPGFGLAVEGTTSSEGSGQLAAGGVPLAAAVERPGQVVADVARFGRALAGLAQGLDAYVEGARAGPQPAQGIEGVGVVRRQADGPLGHRQGALVVLPKQHLGQVVGGVGVTRLTGQQQFVGGLGGGQAVEAQAALGQRRAGSQVVRLAAQPGFDQAHALGALPGLEGRREGAQGQG